MGSIRFLSVNQTAQKPRGTEALEPKIESRDSLPFKTFTRAQERGSWGTLRSKIEPHSPSRTMGRTVLSARRGPRRRDFRSCDPTEIPSNDALFIRGQHLSIEKRNGETCTEPSMSSILYTQRTPVSHSVPTLPTRIETEPICFAYLRKVEERP